MKRIISTLAIACLLSKFSFGQIEQKVQLELNNDVDKFGLAKSDVQNWIITSQHDSKQFDITYAYIQQTYNGIPVFNAVANFAINDAMTVLMGNDFEANLENRVNATSPSISREDAIRNAALNLNITESGSFEVQAIGDNKFVASSIAHNEIPVTLVYAAEGNDVKLAWNLNVDVKGQDHWWNVRIDALTGELINKNDWTVSCTFEHDHAAEMCGPIKPHTEAQVMMPAPPPGTDQYNVFEFPLESPNHWCRLYNNARK
jgi:Zn-dependent metalloprotease